MGDPVVREKGQAPMSAGRACAALLWHCTALLLCQLFGVRCDVPTGAWLTARSL
jgi:hypothetical protein